MHRAAVRCALSSQKELVWTTALAYFDAALGRTSSGTAFSLLLLQRLLNLLLHEFGPIIIDNLVDFFARGILGRHKLTCLHRASGRRVFRTSRRNLLLHAINPTTRGRLHMRTNRLRRIVVSVRRMNDRTVLANEATAVVQILESIYAREKR